VSKWATRRRPEKANSENLLRIPPARTIARLTTVSRDSLWKSETVTVAAIEDGVLPRADAREVIARVPRHDPEKVSARSWGSSTLSPRATPVTSFANGITNDRAAVSAAITSRVVPRGVRATGAILSLAVRPVKAGMFNRR
jgi:hypothetical protein